MARDQVAGFVAFILVIIIIKVLGGNLVFKNKAMKCDVVGERPATKYV